MSTPTSHPISPQALAGIKVIELGQLIAGPFAGKTLADFGAEVIKIEPPAVDGAPDGSGGDPLRQWRRRRAVSRPSCVRKSSTTLFLLRL